MSKSGPEQDHNGCIVWMLRPCLWWIRYFFVVLISRSGKGYWELELLSMSASLFACFSRPGLNRPFMTKDEKTQSVRLHVLWLNLGGLVAREMQMQHLVSHYTWRGLWSVWEPGGCCTARASSSCRRCSRSCCCCCASTGRCRSCRSRC